MKVRIIENGKAKKCIKCGNEIFRLSKNRVTYTNKEKTKGFLRTIEACDKCSHKVHYNKSNFVIKKGVK